MPASPKKLESNEVNKTYMTIILLLIFHVLLYCSSNKQNYKDKN